VLDPSLLLNASGWTVLGLLVALGWLVPKRTVDREQRLLTKEADAWRAAHDTEAAQLDRILEELRKSATGGRQRSARSAPDRET